MASMRNDRRSRSAWIAAGLMAAAAAHAPAQLPTPPVPPAAERPSPEYTLDQMVEAGLGRNPRLAQAVFAIDAAQGRALQAGLYPNPTMSFTFDELGDRTGPKGVNTLPLVTQEIVTAGKLKLNVAVACKDVNQAALALSAQRAALMANVRVAYYEVVALQRRVEILDGLVTLADLSVAQTQKLLDAKLSARLDLVQLEVEAERLRADQQAAARELPAAFRRLAAAVGVSNLPAGRLRDTLDLPLPDYDLDGTRTFVLGVHPEVLSAHVGIDRARLALRRAQVEPIPNVTVGAGYVRQNQNRSDDWTASVSVPVPVWNRNQGNIRAAQAQAGEAEREVARVQNDLTDRVAAAFRDYAAARQRAVRYRDAILPRAQETYDLSLKAYQGGQFEYLRVIEAQRSIAQAKLEYARALGEAWKAASALSGLTLEEQWPPVHEQP